MISVIAIWFSVMIIYIIYISLARQQRNIAQQCATVPYNVVGQKFLSFCWITACFHLLTILTNRLFFDEQSLSRFFSPAQQLSSLQTVAPEFQSWALAMIVGSTFWAWPEFPLLLELLRYWRCGDDNFLDCDDVLLTSKGIISRRQHSEHIFPDMVW